MAASTPTPVYTDVAAEYRAITEGVGLHDSSYAGRLKAVGDDALDLLNRLSTNGIVNLAPQKWAPTILTTDRGRILDLISVVNTGDYTLLLTSPGCQQTIIDWLDKYTIMEDLTVVDITGETAMFTLCGPDSFQVLAVAFQCDGSGPVYLASSLEGNSLAHTESADCAALIIHRPRGPLEAYDVMVSSDAAQQVWEALAGTGATLVGLEAFNAALVQNAVPRHGREMGDAYNPLEAGLIGSVDFAKGCYIGQEVIARLDTYKKVQRYLVRLRFSDDATVAEGAGLELDGLRVGQVTSLATLPSTGRPVGLGYVRTARANPGQTLTLAPPSGGAAEIMDLPQLFGPGE
jgi:folate-binding protein YgfZ